MSKKNIIRKEKVGPDKVHVTFQNDDGQRVYLFTGAAARSVMKRGDPGDMKGKLVHYKKA